MNIQCKFMVIILMIVCIFASAAIGGFVLSGRLLESQIQEKYLAVSVYTMEKIHRLFIRRYEDIRALSEEPVLRSRRSSVHQITEELHHYMTHFKSYAPYASISFFALDRTRLADTSGSELGKRHSLSEYWPEIEKGSEFVFNVSRSESLKDSVFHCARLVRDERGVPRGVVVSRIPVEEMREIVQRPLSLFRIEGTVDVDLVDSDGLILYSSLDKESILRDRAPLFTRLARTQASGSFVVETRGSGRMPRRGKELVIFARESQEADGKSNGWTLIITMPERAALESLSILRNKMAAVSAVLCIVAFGLSFLLARAVTQPIARLSRAMTAVRNGNLNAAVTIRTEDEIGNLSRAFNEMIEELNVKNEELELSAATDRLTGIWNRHRLDQIMKDEIERSSRYGSPLSLILFDVDNFKQINDSYGHLAGDHVLKTICNVVREGLRRTDHFGRWGGEEFMIVTPETDLEAARTIAEKVRSVVEGHAFDIVQKVTVSCGAAQFTQRDSVDSLIRRTDNALYAAKESGRNRVETRT